MNKGMSFKQTELTEKIKKIELKHWRQFSIGYHCIELNKKIFNIPNDVNLRLNNWELCF